MAPDVNWGIVGSIARGGAQDDEAIEQVIEILQSVNEEELRDDSEKLILLLLSARKALDYRELAFNDILQDHEVEVEELKRELEEQAQFQSGAIPRDAEYYRTESRRLNEQKAALQDQNDQLTQEISQMLDEKRTLEQETETIRKMNKDLKTDNQNLRMNLLEYQQIIERQGLERDTLVGSKDVQTKLAERNKQVGDLLDQITDLEKLNRGLEEGTRKLRWEMESGKEDMEQMAEEYEKMRKVISGSDKFADDLQKQNAQLKLQVADLLDQVKDRDSEDNAISRAVNEKIEEWTTRVRQRDEENAAQARTIADLRAKITSASLGHDRIQLEKAVKKLEARDAEVTQLKTALSQAVEEMEEQTAIVEDLRKGEGTNREALAYKAKIRDLQNQVQKNETSMREAQKDRDVAEDDARDTEIKLTEALKRISLLESGQYGLPEAVAEIKDCRGVIRRRDNEIRDLTQVTNKLEEKINDFIEENEEFRERLGLDSRNLDDIVELRKNRVLRQQQFRAENQVLLKEIEALEEERISLKKQIRRQAQSQLQRAADEGLQPDDLNLVDEFIDEVVRMRKQGYEDKNFVIRGSLLPVDKSASRKSDSAETEKIRKLLQIEQTESKKLRQEFNDSQLENETMKKALIEALSNLKNSAGGSKPLHMPVLDRLLEVLGGKAKTRVVRYTSESGVDQSEHDNLIGRNEELRSELKKTRKELVDNSKENKTLERQNDELKAAVESLEKMTKEHMNMRGISLPDNVEPHSRDVINALNEQLIEVLRDREVKVKKLKELNETLENSRRQFQVIRHQTHLLYQEHHSEMSKSKEEKKMWQSEKEAFEERLEKDAVILDEYERLLSTLESSPDDMKRKLAETSRKVSLLRVNEKTLIRRHKSLEATEDMLRLDNQRLKREIDQIEKVVSERIGYLERYKTMAKFKLESLQKSLEGSVPESDLLAVNRRFDELTVKYRDMLQKENQFVSKNVKLDTLQEEIKIANDTSSALRSELAIEKQKRHTMEEALKKSNVSLDVVTPDDSLFKKVTVLEMKELNERQKAEHAERMYNRVKDAMEEMQRRNQELEAKFAELTRLNLAAQQAERELRDELADAVPRSVCETDRKKISSLEEELAKAQVKMSKLHDMAEISQNQLHSVQSQQQARDREMKSLRQQLREFQVQTDEHALIGKLHHQVLSLQASEADTLRKFERAEKNVSKLESHVLKLEKQLDEKDDSIYVIRVESTNKAKQLRKTIQSLRHQFSGALPLAQQEKFSQVMNRMQRDKLLIQEELRKTRDEREKMEDRLAEAEIKKASLDELKQAIQDGRGADKLTEWSQRMDKLRLQDMKLQRQVLRQGEQLKYMENLNNEHEKTISGLEEDIVQLLKAQEEHQVEWEVREMELERLLDQFQSRQRDVTRKAKRLEEVTQFLPDPSLPPSEQLSQALDAIREQSKTMADLQGHVKALEFESDRLKDVRHNLESDVASRDRVINELRLHMPTTTSSALVHSMTKDTDTNQQLRVAMETIETLKKRLAAKEESLLRYKQLMDESRKDQEIAAANHERELMMMQQKLHLRTDEAFSRFKTGSAFPSKTEGLSPREVAHITELEDMVREQDAALAALMDRVRAANADVSKQKQTITTTRKQCETERNKLIEEHESAMTSIRLKLAKKQQIAEGLEKELIITKEELERQREANTKAPMTTMKNLVIRLKQQLHDKEKQQQKLSHALTELRSDLVEQAQENVRAHNVTEADAHNVKVLVERRTAYYKNEVEELKDKIAELQRGLKQAKRNEDTLHGELKKVLEENEKKEQNIKKLKMELRGKDSDVGQLRDKVKRLVKSRSAQDLDEEPVRLDPRASKSEGEGRLVVEDVIEPVAAGSQEGSRPSSGRPRSRPSSASDASKIERLRGEIANLRVENDNLKQKLKAQQPSRNTLEVAKWDAKKQWQNKVEHWKSKVLEKDKQIEILNKQVGSLRESVSRLEREKARRGVSTIGPPIHAQGTDEQSVAPRDHAARQHRHKIEELSRRLNQLGEENSELRHSVVLPREKLTAEMEENNRILSQKLENLEKEVLNSGVGGEKSVNVEEHYRSRENQLQGRILKLSSENAGLLFEIEQIKLDLPRLRERVEYQQKFIELLQSEKKEAQARASRMKPQPQPTKKVVQGTSGKSVVELEKTVALMKRLVERVQRENDQLKKAPGVVSNQQLDEMKSENELLKDRLHEMTQQIGGQLSKRYESKTQSVEKLVSEIDRLKSEINKQVALKEKIRNSKESLQTDKDKLVKEVEDLKKKLAAAEKKAPKLPGSSSKGYNSVVTCKMLEAKLKKCEEETADRNREVEALRNVMREKTEQERNLKEENRKLHEQNELLERFPPNAGGADANTVRELQLHRLTVARLESEKEELQHQLDVHKRAGSEQPRTSATSDADVGIRAEVLRLEMELKVKDEEKRNMQTELDRMKAELAHFDAGFFDEIEDLKYNYSESMRKNVQYEEQLRALSQQFGVQVDVPSSDSD